MNVLQKRKISLPLYLRLLKRVFPKVIVLVTGYGKQNLIEAAKRLRIPVVELQHGVIYPMHLAYNYPTSYIPTSVFPDYILVWGDYWKESADFPLESDRIVSVGYPYMNLQKEKYSKIQRKKQILFISQGGLGSSISNFAVNLFEHLGKDYEIVYKLHPGEWHNWRQKYPELVDSGLTVLDTASEILYKLFAESMIQIGVSSTAIYEGLAFGLRTFLIDTISVEFMNRLVELGYAQKVASLLEMQEYLSEKKDSDVFDHNIFFRENAILNIINFLKRFL